MFSEKKLLHLTIENMQIILEIASTFWVGLYFIQIYLLPYKKKKYKQKWECVMQVKLGFHVWGNANTTEFDIIHFLTYSTVWDMP